MNRDDDNLPATSNPFLDMAKEPGATYTKYLKFSKTGEWTLGPDQAPPAGARFAVNVAGAKAGFTRFVDGHPAGEVMVPIALGKKVRRDELPRTTAHPGDKDDWKECMAIQLRMIETGEECEFSATSFGGRKTIKSVGIEYGRRLLLGNRHVPIVVLAATSYKHARYGIVYEPVLKIVEWRDEVDLMNGGSIDPGKDPDDDIPF